MLKSNDDSVGFAAKKGFSVYVALRHFSLIGKRFNNE